MSKSIPEDIVAANKAAAASHFPDPVYADLSNILGISQGDSVKIRHKA